MGIHLKVASIINLIHLTKMGKLRDYSPGLYERHKVLPSDLMGGVVGSMFGNTYWLIKLTDSRYGQFKADYDMVYPNGNHAVQTDLEVTLALLGPYDTIYLAPGNWTGNYQTPLNATAPFCSLIGIDPTGRGFGPWMGATTSSSPIIEVRARGWRIAGIEFDCPSAAEAIRLTKVIGLTSRCDYCHITHNLFTGGKYAINFYGGGTYIHILDNIFDLMTGATSIAITCTNSDYQVPGMCRIKRNDFLENKKHIDMAGLRGFNSSVITDNYFQLDGNAVDATVLLDIRQSGTGNNTIRRNFFGCTKTQFKDGSSTAFVRGNSGDIATYDNMCSDGILDGNIGE